MADGFVFFPSFHEAIKDLPDTERLGVYDALVKYGLYGEIAEMQPLVKSLFVLMRPVVDSSQRRYLANRENGKKGGRPPKKPTENQIQTQLKPGIYQEKESESESESESEKDSDEKPEKESSRGKGDSFYRPLDGDAFEKEREKRIAMLGL